MKFRNNIILALDVEDKNHAYNIIDNVIDYLDTIKIGYPLTLSEGPKIIKSIKEDYDVQIIADFKEIGRAHV